MVPTLGTLTNEQCDPPAEDRVVWSTALRCECVGAIDFDHLQLQIQTKFVEAMVEGHTCTPYSTIDCGVRRTLPHVNRCALQPTPLPLTRGYLFFRFFPRFFFLRS